MERISSILSIFACGQDSWDSIAHFRLSALERNVHINTSLSVTLEVFISKMKAEKQ